MLSAYQKFWKFALRSEGKTSRTDYLWTFLVNSIIRFVIIAMSFVLVMIELFQEYRPNMTVEQVQALTQNFINHPPVGFTVMRIIGTIFSLIIMVPVTTLTARRLRDAGFGVGPAYPLPAIYLGNAVLEFYSIPGLNFLSLFFVSYALMLLLLCIRKVSHHTDSKNPFGGDL